MSQLTLVQRIRQEARHPVKVKPGVTNGLPVAHVITLDSEGNAIDSRTLKSVAEWTLHPLHPDYNKTEEVIAS